MAKPIAFGEYQFKTKKSATEEARSRINQYMAGSKLNASDEHFFRSLFTLHSEYEEKVGPGIDYITVELDFHRNRCLYIHRVDGSKVDCSWVHCIQPATKKTIISMAFRRAVKQIVMNFKEEQLPIVKSCPVFDTPLDYQNSHVAYSTPSFESLLDNFLTENQLDIESIPLLNPKPNDSDQRGILADEQLAKCWSGYHRANANINLMSQEANLLGLKN